MEQYKMRQCLDGEWRLYLCENKDYSGTEPITTEQQLKLRGYRKISARVPGNFELDLERAGLLEDLFYDQNTLKAQELENRHLWYVQKVTVDPEDAENAFLRFEGVDTVAEYYLNGEKIAETDNMFLAHELGKGKLKAGENELIVHILPFMIAARKRSFGAGITTCLPYNFAALPVRKCASMLGWDIMPRIVSAGIWRSVYLVSKKPEYLDEVYLYNQGECCHQQLYVKAEILGDFINEYAVEIEGHCGDASFFKAAKLWHSEQFIGFNVDNPKLWWPRNMGEQNLYDVTVTLKHGDTVLGTKSFRYGFRTVELRRTDCIAENGEGDFRFLVNGEDFFVMGTNWVPLDALHSRDKKRLPAALKLLCESGCNMIRCWGGNVYADDELFRFCDEHGIAVWQDFAMGCAVYPQDDAFLKSLETEVTAVVKKYRQHCSLFLWAGDNEVDQFLASHRDPNRYRVTRELIPNTLERHDPYRDYLPSSPYISEKAYFENCHREARLPEDHLWGPRRYYKESFYTNANCRFASETGYHGCNSPKSIEKFIAPEHLWPWQDNDSWLVHAACMELSKENNPYRYRIKLMASHLDILFGDTVENSLESFATASQISQAEAFKFFIERFRYGKGVLRTGIIWWNLLDGWPQFSDAVVDYYYCRKLAYFVIKRAQAPVCMFVGDKTYTKDGCAVLCVGNETLAEKTVEFTVRDVASDKVILSSQITVPKNCTKEIATLKEPDGQGMLLIEYTVDGEAFKNHYIYGDPTFDFETVKGLYEKAGILNLEGF